MKEKYQLVSRSTKGSFPVEWNKLPAEVLYKITSNRLVDLLCYSEERGLTASSVAFFRKVSEFEGVVDLVETEQIIYGL